MWSNGRMSGYGTLLEKKVCTWQKVRHLPANSTMWNPTIDQLRGFDFYGNMSDSSKPWTIEYNMMDFQFFKFRRLLSKPGESGPENSEVSFVLNKKTVLDKKVREQLTYTSVLYKDVQQDTDGRYTISQQLKTRPVYFIGKNPRIELGVSNSKMIMYDADFKTLAAADQKYVYEVYVGGEHCGSSDSGVPEQWSETKRVF